MKVGILTFHRAENFGAVLQAYALQTFLGTLGFSAQIIDYRCKGIEEQYQIFSPSVLFKRKNIFASLKIYFSRLNNIDERMRKKKAYALFRRNYLKLSRRVTSRSLCDYEAYVAGSDQVWNTFLTGGIDDFYFLNKKFMIGSKKISYAASCEEYNYKSFSTNENNVLNQFDHMDGVSVREKKFAEILGPLIKKDVNVNIDPTFLLSPNEYLKIAKKPKEKNYILVYHLVESKESSRIACSLAENGQRIIEIHAGYNGGHQKDHLYSLGPTELLGYIAYADSVVTTSFHGLALSLIFHKKVVVVDARNNARLKSLLDFFNLKFLLVSDESQLHMEMVDFEKVDEMISTEKKKTKKYFEDVLKV